MINFNKELDIIGGIYDTALNPGLWKQVLLDIKNAANIDGCDMYFYDSQYRARIVVGSAIASEDYKQKYVDEHIENEVRVVSERYACVPEGSLVEEKQLTHIQNRKYEDNFDEQYKNEMLYKGIRTKAGILIKNGFLVNSVMGFKCFADRPPISRDAMAFLRRIAPHVVQSVNVYNHITSLEKTFSTLHSVLDSIQKAVFLIDSRYQVIYSNKKAGELLASDAGLRLASGGRLSHIYPEVDALLRDNMLEMLYPDLSTGGVTLSLSHPKGLRPLSCNLVSIHPEHDERFGCSGARLAIYICDPNLAVKIPRDYLKLAYNLTPAELDVAEMFVNEASVEKISEKRLVCTETSRGQVKKLFEKTRTHSQPELMKLLVSLSAEIY